MTLVSSEHRVELERKIRWAGFSPLDFTMVETPVPAGAAGVPQQIAGWVTIRRLSTTVARTYAAGGRGEWIAKFTGDLQSGIFGVN
jgi:hypothetical protein